MKTLSVLWVIFINVVNLALLVTALVLAYKAIHHPTLDTKQAFESLFLLSLLILETC